MKEELETFFIGLGCVAIILITSIVGVLVFGFGVLQDMLIGLISIVSALTFLIWRASKYVEKSEREMWLIKK